MSYHPVYPSLADRIASRIQVDGDCWLYTGYRDGFGYGFLRDGRRVVGAHRAAWELANGPIPDGMCVLHRCDVPACVNVDHLWLGTLADNNNDRHAKGRTGAAYGTRNSGVRLTEDQVRTIRLRYDRGDVGKSIARDYGVYPSTISLIGLRKTWRHLA